MLKIKVKDFGPIARGEIVLRPLTVFVGPNSSGKSFLASLVYALSRAAAPYFGHQGDRFLSRRFVPDILDYFEGDYRHNELAANWYKKTLENKKHSKDKTRVPFSAFPAWLQKRYGWMIKRHSEFFPGAIEREVQRCFGTEISDLVRKTHRGNFSIDISCGNPLLWSLSLRSSGDQLRHKKLVFRSTLKHQHVLLRRRRTSLYEPSYFIDQYLTRDVLASVHGGLGLPAYYFPAARSGLLQSHKLLASFFVREAPLVGIRKLDLPQLSGVITDFIGNLLNLRARKSGPLKSVALFLEQNALLGDVSIEVSKSEYPEIVFRDSRDARFALYRTSSMISEIAPLILLLKHSVEPGDLLIIEEPESHLHPATQRYLARAICQMVRAGSRIILTTHSDYLLGEINNFIKISNLSPSARRRKHILENEYIRPDEVSAYLFRLDYRHSGTIPMPLSVTTDDGISEEEFSKVAEALYERSLALQPS